MSEAEVLTHSRLACFRSCPRKHQIRYEFALRPEEDAVRISPVPSQCSAFARAVEAVAKGEDAEAALRGELEDPFDAALTAAMFAAHEAWYAENPLEHVSAEHVFNIPLVNPDSGMPSRTWLLGGKIDRIIRLADGRLALAEYKTTSRDFAHSSPYWLKLHMDVQLSLYVIAARELGFDVSTILYDVTRRPGLRPLKATPLEARKYKAGGILYANQRDQDETPVEYATRCAASMMEAPERHFARIEIARTDADLAECMASIWTQQMAIRQAQLSGRWYRNPENCVSSTGYVCEYLQICLNSDLAERTPLGFRRATEVHEELAAVVAE